MNYARGKTTLEIKNNKIIANNEKQILYLYSSINVDDILNKKIMNTINTDTIITALKTWVENKEPIAPSRRIDAAQK